ncbi:MULTISPECIES: ribulose-bisphosphate carboxylase large subunit family protein [Halomonas]|uniref:ribulose-bisphosphate carboxylase large subunit family protein n=1 Tax=Halomonas TaxID=2745 RepID=UPI001C9859A4|nr:MULTISPECIES: ribulose-bisphosphate carboxylase large subunit family protein [Halomonas]MBY6207553.1 ribulose-bisphosphate carboxylase large subunit family protein [Halomonas sp. DP3Y7-2]MBY6228362.1 ribulose-bisphosphate carboxylase large subunit family protein [Halomonas sp. DP3Y7-1]MCA0916427.1 ribulose-bisphosphate carboxylase large subunit family protein [Halomonas denitrificans]
MSRIEARYLIETPFDVAHACDVMAGEQSCGTFTRLAAETDELRERHAARVESIELLDSVTTPSLPMPTRPQPDGTRYQRARVTLSWPLENLGPSLTTLMATLAGNLYELKEFSGLRLESIQLPDAFAGAYPGPQFGIAGTRQLTGIGQGPLIGTIIKPSVGLDPQATASVVQQLLDGGIDFIKDDELQANGPHNPLEARVDAIMPLVHAHQQKTGRKVMVAFNITGEIDDMRRHHDHVLAAGGSCVMVALNAVGLAGVSHLRRHCQLPIHGHRAGWGMFSRDPLLGMDFAAWQTFWRLAGADHLHVNGLANKFSESDASVAASARACLTPLFPAAGPAHTVMPVFSSNQTACQAIDTWRAMGGSSDMIVTAGGGIMAHPGGIAAGVRSLRQAYDAAAQGVSLAEHAREHRELAQALETFCP